MHLAKALRSDGIGNEQPFLAVAVNNSARMPTACLAVGYVDSSLPTPLSPVFKRAASIVAVALDHAELHQKLAFQAHYDALTDLPNRILFGELLQQEVVGGKRQPRLFGILVLDVKRFRHINDIYGNRAGDALLRKVARRLREGAGAANIVARLGGDEFAVLLRGYPSPDALEDAAYRIYKDLRKPISVQDSKMVVSCSAGFTVFPIDSTEAAGLIRNANAALSQAKRKPHNSWQRYDSQVGVAISQTASIERHLRNAIPDGELQLLYQPQLDPQGCIVGVEALMRWYSTALGPVSPAQFIAVAEQSGLIVDLGTWALAEACRQWKRWQAAGMESVRMAVNVSAVQLRCGNFASKVRRILENTGMDPCRLELEVTESAMMESMIDAITELERVRALGVRVSIDDFGTGYSSLSYLGKLPVDALKIDRAFVRDLDDASRSAVSVVEAVIALAHSLKLQVVAEGVETEAQMRVLTDLKCDLVQGYLFHLPLAVDAVEFVLRPSTLGNGAPRDESAWLEQLGQASILAGTMGQ